MTLLDRHFAGRRPGALGVAVSGGSDSLALLQLTAQWAQTCDARVEVATVDHGLRAEAADEARRVAETCAGLGLGHHLLHWRGWDRRGNLQARARAARYGLLAGWGRAQGLDQILLGHTMDDQAETFLLRLARKSGVDGLAAMDPVFARDGQDFGRPLLGVSRQALRRYLLAQGLDWCEDASNSDPAFERVRMRRALEILAPLGIDAAALARSAAHLGAARDALEAQAAMTAAQICQIDGGDVIFDRAALDRAPAEIQHRLLSAALKWISGAAYAPRSAALAQLRQAMDRGRDMTLSGCRIAVRAQSLRLLREYHAVRDLIAHEPLWDRWQLDGPWRPGMEVRALSAEGLLQIPAWREHGLFRPSLLASPSVWQEQRLICAPLAYYGEGWRASIRADRGNFPPLDC